MFTKCTLLRIRFKKMKTGACHIERSQDIDVMHCLEAIRRQLLCLRQEIACSSIHQNIQAAEFFSDLFRDAFAIVVFPDVGS